MNVGPRRSLVVMALAASTAAAACGGRHLLADYDFAGRTVAVTYFGSPAPRLHTGGVPIEGDDPVSAVIGAGSRIAKEVEARRARARLDEAAARVDLAPRMAARTLERAALYLGATPVEGRDAADFILEVDVRSLGLDAASDRAYLFVSAEAVLIDARTGEEIWDEDIRGYDALTPDLDGAGVVPEDAITAGALSTVTVEEFERVLGSLADYVADRISRELREELREVRRDRR